MPFLRMLTEVTLSAMNENIVHFDAPDFAIQNRIDLDSSRRLADAVVQALQAEPHASVRINVCDVRCISASFFNLLFTLVLEAVGADAVRHRIEFVTDSTVMSSILERSREAVLSTDAA